MSGASSTRRREPRLHRLVLGAALSAGGGCGEALSPPNSDFQDPDGGAQGLGGAGLGGCVEAAGGASAGAAGSPGEGAEGGAIAGDAAGMGGAIDAAGAGAAVDAGRTGSPNEGGAGGVAGAAGAEDSAGAGAGAAAGAGGAASCPARFASAFIEHACVHAELGPFVGVAAAADIPVASVDRTHTAYTITLPGNDAEGVVELRVDRSGAYALFVSVELALVVSNLDADRSSLLPIHEQDASGCVALARVAVFELRDDALYELRFGPGAAQVMLILESASDSASWTEACDGVPSPQGGAPDAGECSVESGACGGGCAELRAACTSASDCCSGRCYARECVPPECRTDGYCQSDSDCCLYCHLTESPHCH